MTQTININAPRALTEPERAEIERFALTLVTQHDAASTPPDYTPKRVRFGTWAGALAGVEPEKSNQQMKREAWDALIEKWDK